MAGVSNVHQIGDFRAMSVDAWANIFANFEPVGSCQTAQPGIMEKTCESPCAAVPEEVFGTPMGATVEAGTTDDSPFHAPDDSFGTPPGPNLTPGEPLGFLTSGTPSPGAAEDAKTRCKDALHAALSAESEGNVPFEADNDDEDMPMLEAVEPRYPGDDSQDVSPSGGSPTSAASAWKRISAALPNAPNPPGLAIPNAARQMSVQAHKAKEQMSETVHKAKESALKVPAQMSETAHKSMDFVKGQKGNVRKVPAQMSETAHKSLGYAKEKAGSVSAAVTAKVTQTTQKGFDMARGMRPHARGKVGGA